MLSVNINIKMITTRNHVVRVQDTTISDSSIGFQFSRDRFKKACLVFMCLRNLAPCTIIDRLQADVSKHWSFSFAICQSVSAVCFMDKYILRGQEFCRLWTVYVEQSTCSAAIN